MSLISNKRGAWLHLLGAAALVSCLVAAGCAGEDVSRAVNAAVSVDLPDSLPAGSPFDVGFTWTPSADFEAPSDDYRIFVHFVDPDGNIVVQDDHFPPVPTSQWKAGEPVNYRHWVYTDPELEPAYFDLFVGLYDSAGQVATLAEGGLQNRPLVHSIIMRGEDKGGVPVFVEGVQDWELSLASDDALTRRWRWMGRQATVAFGNPRGPSTLHLSALSPVDYLGGTQTVTIRVQDREIARFELDESVPYIKRFDVPGDVFGEGDWVDLIIEVDKTFVPAQVEPESDDIRELGLQIYWMYLAR